MKIELNNLKFDKNGLIPAIIVDSKTKNVLTLAYMNEQSLKITLEKKLTCFWSRSRNCLWLKGETSGNYQHVESITADCVIFFSFFSSVFPNVTFSSMESGNISIF